MDPMQKAVLNKVAWRLVPVLTLAYIVNYLDRTNIGFAALTMNKELGFTATQFGIGAGILFISYTVFEIPSNLALYRFGARIWIARIMITWGLVSAATAFVNGVRSYYLARFALGVAEAGFFPGVAYYLSAWFPAQYRSRMLAWFLIGIPASSVIGAPLSGLLLQLDGVFGLRGWQWLFVVEGVPAIILGILVLRLLVDRPETATFLKPDEREALLTMLAQEHRERPKEEFFSQTVIAALVIGMFAIVAACVLEGLVFGGGPQAILVVGMTVFTVGMITVAAFFDIRVFICALVQFGFTLGSYGVGIFLPLIIKTSGLSNMVVSLLTAIPYVFASVAMIWWAWHADRSGRKIFNLAVACALATVGLVGSVMTGNLALALTALTVAVIGITSARAIFWSIPARFLTGVGAAAGLALINSIGTIGGFAGPSLMGWLKDQTGSFERGLLVMAAILAVTTLCAAALRLVMKVE